ncbi:MAG TPA: His/Gly/Thr/Pro-type tRNA ligase C-terminal domain-containing protein, partial [Desulfurivibrionaceae bacterium]|nr:His/Gly/Thr/Pro-type tRNA ligase C-terminal domain-containing protein [Desulfurivibrionaceae bacterium]
LLNLSPKDAEITAASEGLYRELTGLGIEVLLDDRDERPGSKFKDADLIGIPLRVMVGKSFTSEGAIEIRSRWDGETRKVPLNNGVATIRELIAKEMDRFQVSN